MSTARLETFADGVFAIAATLLILNVDAQIRRDAPDLGASLLHIWPSYVAYAASFVTIGIMWINHHAIMSQVDRSDRRFLIVNIGLLMCIAFFPFTTRLVAEHVRGDGDHVQPDLVLRRPRQPVASPRCRPGRRARPHPLVYPRALDLPGRHARRLRQPGRQH